MISGKELYKLNQKEIGKYTANCASSFDTDTCLAMADGFADGFHCGYRKAEKYIMENVHKFISEYDISKLPSNKKFDMLTVSGKTKLLKDFANEVLNYLTTVEEEKEETKEDIDI